VTDATASAPVTPPTGSDPTPGPSGLGRRLSRSLSRHPRVELGALLSGPLLWLLIIYIGSLGSLLLTSLYTTDSYTGSVVKTISFQNFQDLKLTNQSEHFRRERSRRPRQRRRWCWRARLR